MYPSILEGNDTSINTDTASPSLHEPVIVNTAIHVPSLTNTAGDANITDMHAEQLSGKI